MTIKHRIDCFDGEILVRQSGEDGKEFLVNIVSAKNPLSTGNTVGVFPTEETAVAMAERFCSFYTSAREGGYYLRGDSFVKPDQADIPVAFVLDGTKTPDQLQALLMSADGR